MTDTTAIFNLKALYENNLVFLVENKDDALAVMKAGEQAVGLGTGNTDIFLQYIAENKPRAHIVISASNRDTWQYTMANIHNQLEMLNTPHTTISLTTT